MLDEITKSIRAELYDRSVSPLMGSFIISWLLWNYKFVLLFFSELAIDEKFKSFDKLYSGYETEKILFWLIFPSITTIIYLYAYPILAKPVFEYSRKRQKELKEIKTKIEDETPLTIEESRDLRNRFSELEDEYLKEIERKNREIDRLKSQIEETQKPTEPKINELQKDNPQEKTNNNASEHKGKLSKQEVAVLKHLGTSYSGRDAILSEFENRLEAMHTINQLHKRGYLKYSSPNLYSTEKGIAYLVENGLHKD